MACLNEIDSIKVMLKSTSRQNIVALHKYIFEDEGDRSNRKRLREFQGFDYGEEDERYEAKKLYVAERISPAEITSICTCLGLNFEVVDPFPLIFNNLRKGMLLTPPAVESDEDDDEETEDDDDNCNDGQEENEQGAMGGSISIRNHNRGNEPKYERDTTKYDDAQSHLSEVLNMSNNATPRFSLSFRDIEDSIRTFDGSNKISIEAWIDEFEETAVVMNWDEFQKFVFAKKLLKGLAALFIRSERGVTSWIKLKTLLIEEFQQRVSSAEIHKQLTERKAKKDEPLAEYLLKMKELAVRGNVEDQALIQYVIDGVNDTSNNKVVLYGAKTLKEFKDKIQCYETMRSKQQRVYEPKAFTKEKNMQRPDKPKFDITCYNCGAKGHRAPNCPNKDKGHKCFSCNQFGHLSTNCPKKKLETSKSNMRSVELKGEKMMKEVKVGLKSHTALFDTGSVFNLITHEVYKNIKERIPLKSSHVKLKGFGENVHQNSIQPLGGLTMRIEVDGTIYNENFLVVADTCLDVQMILGAEFCRNKEVTINDEGVRFKAYPVNNQIQDEVEHTTEIEEPFAMMTIDQDHTSEIDIDPMASVESREEVLNLINNYEPSHVKSTNVELKIVLTDETPIFSRPHRLPMVERRIVDEQIEKWLRDGIIEPSESEYVSPVVLVKKRDGTPRLCVDYRKINKVMVKDKFPLPLIEDQLDNLKGATVFSTIDLENGFFHVPVAKESRKYTAFITHNGIFQFKVTPFGMCNSPSVFQRHINAVFRDLSKEGIAFPYIDDVIITANNDEEAVVNLKKVIACACEYGLKLNKKKCQFLKRQVEFLGHVIHQNQISPSPRKIEALMKYEVPKSLKDVQSFLGLASYFRKFIRNFSIVAKPLSDLLKQNSKFRFDSEHMQSFQTLKELLSQKPVLGIYNDMLETELHTDASIDGYGAVLLQKSLENGLFHPIYYMSRKTTEQERKYSSYELEVLAVIEALKRFRVYLLGIEFKIVTDCDAFTKTMNKRDLCTRVARWVLLLEEFKYKIEHRSGSQMRHVDALSRHPVMIIAEENIIRKLKRAQSCDDALKPIVEILKQQGSYEDYHLKSDVLYKTVGNCEKMVIPKNMQYELIKEAHEKGHFGAKKTKEAICDDYFIPGVDEKINNIITNCIPCILINRKRGKQEGELNPLPKPEIPLHTYHMDFVGPLDTTSKMYKHLLVIVDSFTKFCWLYPTKTTSAACVIAKLSLQSVTFGNPSCIITDRGSAFTSDDFKQYCESEGIYHIKVTTGLPRANGQVERLNAVVASVLAKISIQDPMKWYRHVEAVQRYINASTTRSTTFSPFELLIGVKMKNKGDEQICQLIDDELKIKFNDDRMTMRQQAKTQLLKIQDENRRTFDKKRKPANQYKIGDLVAIKRTQMGGGLKLRPKYLGPYEIIKVKSNNTYDVEKKGQIEGPIKTTSCAEYLKPWCKDTFGANVLSG